MDSLTVSEFVRRHDLPVNAAVTGGNYTVNEDSGESEGNVKIQQGNILKLNSLSADFVYLHYIDEETGSERKIRVQSDLHIKFIVLDDHNNTGDSNIRTDEARIFNTIRDLLDVNPTKFKANSNYEDDAISGISIKKGDVFHTCRIIADGQDKPSCLECVNSKGDIFVLPLSCHGDFSLVFNREEFTLKQLIVRGQLDKTLQFANSNTEVNHSNKSRNGTSKVGRNRPKTNLSSLGDLPLTFQGSMTMEVPDVVVEGNLWGTENSFIQIPITTDLQLRPYTPDEYESPVSNVQNSACCKLRDIINTYRDELPIIVSLVSYSKIPEEFSEHLFKTQDLVIHANEEVHKVLGVCDKRTNICIDRNVEAMCQTVPRTFRKICDLENCVNTNILILENLASDVPSPFSLKFGDTLTIAKFQVCTTKLKSGRKFLSECKYIKCLKSDAISNETTVVKLPLDLEVIMLELLKPEISRFNIRKIFDGIVKLPTDVIIYETENSDRIPLNCPLRLCHKIWDSVAVVSPLKRSADMEPYVKTFEPRISHCLEIPLRHDILVAFKRKLDLPARYFKMPLDSDRVCVTAEEISERTLNDLEHNTADYELFLPTVASSGNISKGTMVNKLRNVRRLGRSISSTIRSRSSTRILKRNSAPPNTFTEMIRPASTCSITEMDPSQSTSTVSDEEEHLYETVDLTKKPPTKSSAEQKKRNSGLFGFLSRQKKENAA